MSKVFICAAKRTAVGSMLGSLKNVPATEFGAEVVKNILAETKLDPRSVNEVIVGNVLCAGLGQGVGRQVSLKAGIPEEVPAYAVSMVCGSGMKAILNGFLNVKHGEEDLVICGGIESMSRAPYLIPSTTRTGVKMGGFTCIDHMIFDSLTDAYSGVHMGITAENIAAKYGITREAQDAFSFHSQEKAIASVDAGLFDEEIVPITIHDKKGDIVFARDEFPNRSTSIEKLAKLKPAFKKDGGTVTAGNASGLNDGAAFLLLASEKAVKEHGLTPLCEIVEVGQGGVDPQYMGLGPVAAVRNVLNRSGLKLADMDVIELNEAFAAQSLGVVKLLSEEHGVSQQDIFDKTNIRGGAIAIGHPVGASGARITVTLVHIMLASKVKYGLASLCIGGGLGTALILKKI